MKYIWGGVALVVVIGVAGGIIWSMSSNQGTVITQAPNRPADQPLTTKTVDGPYISFGYSSIYKMQKLPVTTDDLESYYLTASTNYEKHLAVTVSRLDGGVLSNFGGYSARSLHPELYSHQDVTVDGSPAVLVIKKDNTERTVFAAHGDRVVALAFVSIGGVEDVQAEIDGLLSTFHWKQ